MATDDQSGAYSTNLDSTPYTGPHLYDIESAGTTAYQSHDNAGNLEALKSPSCWVDTQTPITVIAPPTFNNWVSGVMTITGISLDETSGLTRSRSTGNGRGMGRGLGIGDDRRRRDPQSSIDPRRR